MTTESNPLNREFHYFWDLLYRGKYTQCLFDESCTEQAIWAHSISRSMLSTMQNDGKVLEPGTRRGNNDKGRPMLDISFVAKGIKRASTGTFTCRRHDEIFTLIDSTEMDLSNPRVLNLLFFRAILRDLWTLLRTQNAKIYLQKRYSLPDTLLGKPEVRMRALFEAKKLIGPFLEQQDCPILSHIVRYVKTDRPFLAASYGTGGFVQAFDRETGQEVSADRLRRRLSIEPNCTWSFSVIPQGKRHAIVASCLKNSNAENYFSHLKTLNGKELESAISAELIFFCENWFIHPI